MKPECGDWTSPGEVIEVGNKKYICGTGEGHFYLVQFSDENIAVGLRQLLSSDECRVRVQFLDDDSKVDIGFLNKLRELDMERFKRHNERGFHFSKLCDTESEATSLIHEILNYLGR